MAGLPETTRAAKGTLSAVCDAGLRIASMFIEPDCGGTPGVPRRRAEAAVAAARERGRTPIAVWCQGQGAWSVVLAKPDTPLSVLSRDLIKRGTVDRPASHSSLFFIVVPPTPKPEVIPPPGETVGALHDIHKSKQGLLQIRAVQENSFG